MHFLNVKKIKVGDKIILLKLSCTFFISKKFYFVKSFIS
nr:MAG TPA: hypothetical protein [Caudoviricetes sp.]